eukprot:6428671-Amphidinium_carterae.1
MDALGQNLARFVSAHLTPATLFRFLTDDLQSLTGVDSPQHVRDRLSTAWFAWQVLQLLGPSAAIGAAFDFTDSGIDRCLQALQPSIHEVRLEAIAVHIQSCSKCQDGLLVVGMASTVPNELAVSDIEEGATT